MDPVYTYDTETSYDGTRAWIWSWGLCDPQLHTVTGNGLDATRILTSLPDKSTVWVHNLSFDGEFIYWDLLRRGYSLEYGVSSFGRHHGVFELFEDLSGILKIVIYCEGRRITLRDSFRLFRCKLEELPKLCGFDDEDAKVEGFDYDSVRQPDHVKTPFEEAYQVHDVTVLMRALQWIRGIQQRGNTIGAIAIEELKSALAGRSPFKPLTPDQRFGLRSLYSGGVVKLPGDVAGRLITGAGKVYDRNSMYPSESIHPLPVRLRGINVDDLPGDPDPDGRVAYAVHVFAQDLQQRPGGFPLIVTPFTGNARSYIPSIEKWFFLEEWRAIQCDYRIGSYTIISVASFDQKAFARPFVEKWYDVKQTHEGPIRTFAKFVLNNFTGKLAQNAQLEQIRRIPQADGTFTTYRHNEYDHRPNKWLFMPATARITSRSRLALREADRLCGGSIYTDTDSVFTFGDLPQGMIDHSRLGAWDCENTFDEALFVKPKSYWLRERGRTVKIKHAGVQKDAAVAADPDRLPDRVSAIGLGDVGDKISPDNMRAGQLYLTKQAKRVQGGVAIVGVVKQM